MRRRFVSSLLVGLLVVGSSSLASAAVVTRRLSVPAPATDSFGLDALACSTSGNCWGAGIAQNAANQQYPFVVQEVAGSWKSAIKLTLPVTPVANMPTSIVNLTCPTTSYCLLTVSYSPSLSATFGARFEFKNGAWTAGTKTVIGGPDFQGDFASSSPATQGAPLSGCWSAGNCVILSYYRSIQMNWLGFSMVEVNGVWQPARRLQSPFADTDNNRVGALSCVNGAGCVALGRYSAESGASQLFAISTTNGTWSEYTDIASPANTGSDSFTIPGSMSCSDLSHCVATGIYGSRTSNVAQFFVIRNGETWAQALAAKLPTGYVQKNNPDTYRPPSVSCASDFTCIATSWGYATTSLAVSRPMSVLINKGTLATATLVQLPSGAVLDARAPSDVTTASCTGAGHCMTTGTYFDAARVQYAFVQSQSAGAWVRAVKLAQPADAHRLYGGGYFSTQWCFANRTCTLGGTYTDVREAGSSSVVEGVAV